ncbi:lipopolysaccharide biosynthesis protein [Marinobacter salarius]|uniref:Teichuronic acid biosynthesis protein TuaB n=1 Tax=Marinobacter salarius TaxID=1420917 RepID=A0A1W6K9G7_9GAMM|nr:lipopolysaccharide biosynthesis protein [Marinobacter salarius]ARM84050.1 teichuronic acid biosynthesis protein TuaB [Marinobacter salarius]
MSEFKDKVLGALSWTAGGKATSQLISIGFGIALARMLTPDDFGLIAMMMVFTGFAGLLMDVGLGSALVQKENVTELHYNTVFWTNLGLGAALTVLIVLISPLIAGFYDREELTAVGYILSFQFILGALALVPRQRLVKRLNFSVVTIADLLGMIVAGVAAIIMVKLGFGYWALAWQFVILRLVATVYIWAFARWVPAFTFSKYALGELFGFSFYVFATQMIRYATQQADKLLAGRFLGGNAVGLLDKAQSMMLFPLSNVSHVVGSVMFPALSMIQNDKLHVRSIYMRCTQAIALLTFPMMAGMFAVAENFVFGVLGEQWGDLVVILRILCVAGIAISIVTVTGSVYLSQGMAKLQFKVNLLTRPIALIGVVAGLRWGVEGVAVGATAATLINTLITLHVAGNLIGLSLGTLLCSFFKTFIAAIMMSAVIMTSDSLLSGLDPLVRFFVQVLEGVIVYCAFAIILKVGALEDVKEVLREKMFRS